MSTVVSWVLWGRLRYFELWKIGGSLKAHRSFLQPLDCRRCAVARHSLILLCLYEVKQGLFAGMLLLTHHLCPFPLSKNRINERTEYLCLCIKPPMHLSRMCPKAWEKQEEKNCSCLFLSCKLLNARKTEWLLLPHCNLRFSMPLYSVKCIINVSNCFSMPVTIAEELTLLMTFPTA